MSDRFYRIVRFIGGLALRVSASPTAHGLENVPRTGPFILASTHESPFDVPLLIHHTPRLLDIVSIVEEFRKPVLGWFYGSMNAFPLDRSRADPKTVRIVLDRLARGRVILIFPEGGIRESASSVVRGGRIRKGVGRIAKLANVPIVPCVVINGISYVRVASWLPLRRTRYGVIYGRPIAPDAEPQDIEVRLMHEMVTLHARLVGMMAR